MNTSKTTLKKTDVDKKKAPKKLGSDGSGASNLKWIITGGIAIVVVIGLIIGISIENFKPSLLMTVNDKKVYMDDVMYYVYNTESSYSYMDQIYQAYYGTSYWDQSSESGVSNRDSAKLELEQTIEAYEILYKEAVDAGYKINDEDKENAKSDVKSIRDALTLEQKNQLGMSKKALTSTLEKKYCADRYKQDIIDGFDIDDEEIHEGVSYDDFRQYDIQYYEISKQTYDEEGNPVDVDDETLKLYKEELEGLAERAKTEDFDSLTPQAVEAVKELEEAEASSEPADDTEDSEDAETEDEVKYNANFTADGNFVVGNGNFTTDFEDAVKTMKNDEISKVIETETSLYLVKMINNDDDEAYEAEVENQITSKENEEFEAWYEDIFAKYTITLNEKVWDSLELGSVIL